MNMRGTILADLYLTATKSRHSLSPATFTIKGISYTDYAIRLGETESILKLSYVVVQTEEQGCCYFDPTDGYPGADANLLGQDALREFPSCELRIAALDAVFGSIIREPDSVEIISGRPDQKARERARIVCDRALRLLRRSRKNGGTWTVANIGVIGTFLYLLRSDPTIHIVATDYSENIVDTEVHGVRVLSGDRSEDVIGTADVAIITGMALANGTLEGLLAAARKNDTAVLIFAQTGAHFAEEYIRLGANCVISEPFPFYLVGKGATEIKLYERLVCG